MITGIQNVFVYVTKMDESVAFYEGLGFSKVFGSEHWTSLSGYGLTLGLHWSEGEEIPLTPRDAHGQKSGATITLKSSNISQDKELILSLGGTVIGEFDADWGHMLTFEDLDKNVLHLMNPKY